ncbi:16488_t:CDS:1, partial [Acaulospora colombiana]
ADMLEGFPIEIIPCSHIPEMSWHVSNITVFHSQRSYFARMEFNDIEIILGIGPFPDHGHEGRAGTLKDQVEAPTPSASEPTLGKY